MNIMKKYWWCILILLIVSPSFCLDFAMLFYTLAIPLGLIIVLAVNGVDIYKAMHDKDKK